MNARVIDLTRLPGVWRGGELEQAIHATVPTGHGSLDRELPGGGWPTGTLSEVLHEGAGIGEVGFLCGALARASGGDRLVAWINPPHLPYAPALAHCGIPLERCLVIRPERSEDALWAAEQALKSGACGAALLWLQAVKNQYAWLRRLQMAAEAGRAMAIHFRPSADEKLSTPAHLRVVVSRADGMLRIRIPKRRGPPLSASIGLDSRVLPLRRRQRVDAARVPQPPGSSSRLVLLSLAS